MPTSAKEFLDRRGLADLSLGWPLDKPVPQVHYPSSRTVPTLVELLEDYAEAARPSVPKEAETIIDAALAASRSDAHAFYCEDCGNAINLVKCGCRAPAAGSTERAQVEVIQHETSKGMYFVLMGQPQVLHPDGLLKFFGTHDEAMAVAIKLRHALADTDVAKEK